jgi:hypothetical protein
MRSASIPDYSEIISAVKYGSGSASGGDGGRVPVTFKMLNPRDMYTEHNFARLVGMSGMIDLMTQQYIVPRNNPTAYTRPLMNILMPNFLLYGPAGTGKTEIIQSLAVEMGVIMIQLSATELHSQYQGETKNRFGDLLKQCERVIAALPEGNKFVIVFIDEADVLLSKPQSKENEDLDIVEVFKEAVGVGIPDQARRPKGVIWVAATNRPGAIMDIGILGRFSLKRYVGYPYERKRATRLYMLLTQLRKIEIDSCSGIKVNWDSMVHGQRDGKLMHDMELSLWFLTPRELSVVTSEILSRLPRNPLKLNKYRYYVIPRTLATQWDAHVAAEQLPKLREGGVAEMGDDVVVPDRKQTEFYLANGIERLCEVNLGGDDCCLEPVDPDRPKSVIEDMLPMFSFEDVKAQHPELLNRIHWGVITFEDVERGIIESRVSTSLTWDALSSFYNYAKYHTKDTAGLNDIMLTMMLGHPEQHFLTQKFQMRAQSKLPKWPISSNPEIYADVSSWSPENIQSATVFELLLSSKADINQPMFPVAPARAPVDINSIADYSDVVRRLQSDVQLSGRALLPILSSGDINSHMASPSIQGFINDMVQDVAVKLAEAGVPQRPDMSIQTIKGDIESVFRRLEKLDGYQMVGAILAQRSAIVAMLAEDYQNMWDVYTHHHIPQFVRNGSRWIWDQGLLAAAGLTPAVPVLAGVPDDEGPRKKGKKKGGY